jgi:hypothetical protein
MIPIRCLIFGSLFLSEALAFAAIPLLLIMRGAPAGGQARGGE